MRWYVVQTEEGFYEVISRPVLASETVVAVCRTHNEAAKARQEFERDDRVDRLWAVGFAVGFTVLVWGVVWATW